MNPWAQQSNQIPSVPDSPEFRRIYNLPRRPLPDRAPLPDYRTPLGVAADALLLAIQTVALNELHWMRGVFAALPVGAGKTLITFLAAHVLGARRPMLFVPANVVEKTRIEFRELSKFWAQPQPMPLIESYTALTLKKNVNMLETINPDALFFDECDQLRLIESGSAPIRIDRFVEKKRAEEVAARVRFGEYLAVGAFTGTIGRGSLRDFAHIMRWCLGPGAPVPLNEGTLWQWCQALDDDRAVGAGRWDPGILMNFAAPEPPAPEPDEDVTDGGWLDLFAADRRLKRVRAGVLQRMIETPGVLIYDESTCTQPIVIDLVRPPNDPEINRMFYEFNGGICARDGERHPKETPDGYALTDSLQFYKHESVIGCGWWDRWDPRAPQDWLACRREWAVFVRDKIDTTRKTGAPLDTEGAVKEAYPEEPALLAWQEIQVREPVFVPNPVQTWYSASVVYAAAQLIQDLEATGERCMVWTWHRAMAQALISVTGLPYYGAEGMRHDVNMKKGKESIERNPRNPDGSPRSSIILSAQANRRGRNLQYYNHAIAIGWEAATHLIEQMLGRYHRTGQNKPCYLTVLLTSGATLDALAKTLIEARTVKALQGHTQKILQAEIRRDKLTELVDDGTHQGSRWFTRVWT
jgi:hypothetical protein